MRKKVNDFFNFLNELKNSTTDAYDIAFTDGIKAFADTMARATGNGVYIFDYLKREVIYVSENFVHWCDIPLEEINRRGYDFYLEYINEEDLKMLIEINDAAFTFFNKLPENECIAYTISYDFHFCGFMVNQHYSPLCMKNGKIWLAVCFVGQSARKESGNIVMDSAESKYLYEYSLSLKKWIPKKKIILSSREKKIIRFSSQGFSVSEIANKLSVSYDAVKSQKRRLFHKLEVSSMSEAINYAINNRLL